MKPVIISGMCKCGHSYELHHLSCIVRQDALDELHELHPDHPPYFPDECCAHGSNETGGMKYNEETDEWEDHCHHYVDVIEYPDDA